MISWCISFFFVFCGPIILLCPLDTDLFHSSCSGLVYFSQLKVTLISSKVLFPGEMCAFLHFFLYFYLVSPSRNMEGQLILPSQTLKSSFFRSLCHCTDPGLLPCIDHLHFSKFFHIDSKSTMQIDINYSSINIYSWIAHSFIVLCLGNPST